MDELEINKVVKFIIQLELHRLFLTLFIEFNNENLEKTEISCINKTIELLDEVKSYLGGL